MAIGLDGFMKQRLRFMAQMELLLDMSAVRECGFQDITVYKVANVDLLYKMVIWLCTMMGKMVIALVK